VIKHIPSAEGSFVCIL